MKVIREWFIDAPWGKIALTSWGNPDGKAVLLVHGRSDSMATFIPLLEHLPGNYCYVGVDMPGTDGVVLTRFFPVCVIEMVVKHLGWGEFYYLGHSMGTEQGLFYNAIFPGQIKKIILLDPIPALQRLVIEDFAEFYTYYDRYYSNYRNMREDRVYTREGAVQAVMKARGMNKEQAELILSRNLIKIGDDLYKLSWDRRNKLLAPTYFPKEYYLAIFCKNFPPALFITAKDHVGHNKRRKEIIERYIRKCEKESFVYMEVNGNHDVHFIHPERVAEKISYFLDENVKSKL